MTTLHGFPPWNFQMIFPLSPFPARRWLGLFPCPVGALVGLPPFPFRSRFSPFSPFPLVGGSGFSLALRSPLRLPLCSFAPCPFSFAGGSGFSLALRAPFGCPLLVVSPLAFMHAFPHPSSPSSPEFSKVTTPRTCFHRIFLKNNWGPHFLNSCEKARPRFNSIPTRKKRLPISKP